MTGTLSEKRVRWLVLGIMVFGFLLRVWRLDFQSPWIDELHSMNISDPGERWATLFEHLRTTDQHPPLHFIVLRLCFALFGHTVEVARALSVVFGTACLWAVYLVGSELYDRKTSAAAMLLMAVNYYCISFSQEARNYIFAVLFTLLSFLFLIRFFKSRSLKHSLLYAICCLFLLYSHYFGMFIVLAQVMLGAIFFFDQEPGNRKQYVLRFLLAGLVIAVGYAPWMPYLLEVSKMTSFWLSKPSNTVFSDYLYTYFGNAALLSPMVAVLLLHYVFKVFTQPNEQGRVLKQPLAASFVILLVWVMGTYMAPYIRSFLKFPVLLERYTIVVVPAYLLAMAISIRLILHVFIQRAIIFLFVLFSLIDMVLIRQYYTKPSKTQFREVTQYVMEHNPDHFPVLTRYNWQLGYYFKRAHNNTPLIFRWKMYPIDSIVQAARSQSKLYGFWMLEGHQESPPLTSEEKQSIASEYVLAERKDYPPLYSDYFDAWAELFVCRRDDSNYHFISCRDYQVGELADSSIAVWNEVPVVTRPIHLDKGTYRVLLSAKGTSAQNEYANIKIAANDKVLGELMTRYNLAANEFTLPVNEATGVTFKLSLTNDLSVKSAYEDRNAFVNCITVRKIE